MNDIKEIIRILGFVQEYFGNHAEEQEPNARKEMFMDWSEIVLDAITLLKAQEPKLVTNIHKEHNNVLNPNVPWVGKCPKCGKKIEGRNLTQFCKFCGQAVKWND